MDFIAEVAGGLNRKLRDNGVRQWEVAKALDRSEGYVSHRLTGKTALSLDVVVAAAGLLGVSPRELLTELMERA